MKVRGQESDAGCLGLVHWDGPERWCREGSGGVFRMGTRVHPWRIHVDGWQNQYSMVQ